LDIKPDINSEIKNAKSHFQDAVLNLISIDKSLEYILTDISSSKVLEGFFKVCSEKGFCCETKNDTDVWNGRMNRILSSW